MVVGLMVKTRSLPHPADGMQLVGVGPKNARGPAPIHAYIRQRVHMPDTATDIRSASEQLRKLNELIADLRRLELMLRLRIAYR
jgi:hypothetical protein